MEGALSKIDTTILDDIIVGRVKPYIYAFSTETVPNYLKVGDTSRGVRVRLDEWRKIFPNLIQQYEHSAQIDDETIFRDFAVHTFLEREKGRIRLQPNTFDNLPYYSREFFKEATAEDVEDAVTDIIQSAHEKNGKYPLYSPDRLPQTLTYERTESYPPRDNQQQAIDNFKKAVNAGRTNLLLYAVMRFGKSFTSMCCAKEIDARFVVIVSAKADVKEEWKKTVESHKYFENYTYLDSKSLKRSETVIADTLADPDKKVALFLTLQDLQGDDIKEKHKEVFEHQIDLLIIDETHFGARGASYGKVLREHLTAAQIKKELGNDDDFESIEEVKNIVKVLNAKVSLHLSGTPYRILMSDEFQKEDIIAFVQFTDIIDAQQRWNDEHLKEDDCEEWKNPYYGFPQMIRFAFNPNESSRRRMEQMRKDGITYAFSELFRPLSMIPQAEGNHRQFKHEVEILDLLEVIDGTKEDENLLGFLDYDKIKEGKMCRHIVCVLPFRASCDAMAALIRKNKGKFKNLGKYEIINIAGFDDECKYKTTADVKRTIKACEERNCKTLTLTVNRMLTGTTVPQWDTMLYLKGTASPQEYDQAIFRLQNQYITTFKDESGKTIKYNMKPQTLLVDFDPNRMFILQELKSQFYNVNTEVQGNAQLKERIAKELEISPIIVLNKNKLQQDTPTNITDAVREYSRTRSILDDASEIPTDNDLLQDGALAAILRTIEPIDAKNGLQIKSTEGEGDDIDMPEGDTDNPKEDADKKDAPAANPQPPTNQGDDDKLEKRLAAYYARILFFAFLTESTVKSLEDVIAQIPATEDNQRIAKHLGLNVGILQLIQRKSNPFVLRKFDYKIENTNDLSRDTSLNSIQRVEVALRKFGRLSDSEVVTPAKVADEMVSILPFDELSAKESAKFLDIASKQGEFTIALYKKFGDMAKEHIYAIPTSKLTYEFTRKTYKLLEMPVENIFADFTSYDLIGENNQEIIKRLTDMKFDAIIGNPPYQRGKIDTSDDPIYNLFYDVAFRISKRVSLITPARFLFNAGKTPKEWNEKMLNDAHFKVLWYNSKSSDVFPDVDIKGGIAIGYRDTQEQYGGVHVYTPYPQLNTLVKKVSDYGYTPISEIFYAQNKFNLEVLYADYPDYRTRIGSNGRERRLTTSIFALTELFSEQQMDDDICILGLIKNQRTYRCVKRKYIEEGGNLDFYKVIVPKSNGTGAIGEVEKTPLIGEPVIGEPHTGVTQSFITFGKFKTKDEADAAHKYIRSKFARTLLGVLKVTQDNSKEVWRYVPLQDFTANSDIDWSKSITEIDAQLYAKYGLSSDEIAFIDSMIKPME